MWKNNNKHVNSMFCHVVQTIKCCELWERRTCTRLILHFYLYYYFHSVRSLLFFGVQKDDDDDEVRRRRIIIIRSFIKNVTAQTVILWLLLKQEISRLFVSSYIGPCHLLEHTLTSIREWVYATRIFPLNLFFYSLVLYHIHRSSFWSLLKCSNWKLLHNFHFKLLNTLF